MKNFKPIREIVKALTNIADAIAGTYKGSNSQDESNDIYDGILEVADGSKIIYFSFGIKDNDNATKLGDLFTDNFINDLNNSSEAIDFVSAVTKLDDTKLNDTKIQVKAVDPGTIIPTPTIYKDGSVQFQYDNNANKIFIGIYGKDYFYSTDLSNEELTKDTPLLKQTI